MQLLKLDTGNGVQIKNEIKHKRFRDIVVNKSSGKERNIEDLIVQYPSLLNFGDFSLDSHGNDELLIISRQTQTSRRKRADLFAIDQDGYLVVIEVKRDAADEKARSEGVEFQAIRYAAASRKMDADAVTSLLAEYLQSKEKSKQQASDKWREEATKILCDHLSDEEIIVEAKDLPDKINPKEKQRIYLVAADYEEEVVSACAWLREHKIDIACFRLRPFEIGTEVILERERLIPPPELDDLMSDSFNIPGNEKHSASPSAQQRKPSNKPTKITWTDNEENPQTVTSWKGLIESVVTRALKEGLTAKHLPMASDSELREDFLAPTYFSQYKIYADLHGSSETIQGWIRAIIGRLKENGKNLGLQVDTANGVLLEFLP